MNLTVTKAEYKLILSALCKAIWHLENDDAVYEFGQTNNPLANAETIEQSRKKIIKLERSAARLRQLKDKLKGLKHERGNRCF